MYKHNLLSVAPISRKLNNLLFCLKADTGASKNFVRDADASLLHNVHTILNGPIAKLPNNTVIQATRKGYLPFSSKLHSSAKEALIYPDLKNASLLSIGQLCDNNCIAIFDKHLLEVIKDKEVILRGYRNFQDGLWDVPFEQPTNLPPTSTVSNFDLPSTSTFKQQQVSANKILHLTPHDEKSNILSCNYILTLDKSKYELAQYLYGCLYAPALPTLETAIRKGNLISWPGIDNINFKKYVGINVAHEKGHLDQERQNLRSTKINPTPSSAVHEMLEDAFPSRQEPK